MTHYIPAEQLKAVADFWAEQYQLEATPEQIALFKAKLQEKVLLELQSCTWSEQNPLLGAYARKFVTYYEYNPSPVLEAALKESGLKASPLSFSGKTVLAINPGEVVTHPDGKIIWQEVKQ